MLPKGFFKRPKNDGSGGTGNTPMLKLKRSIANTPAAKASAVNGIMETPVTHRNSKKNSSITSSTPNQNAAKKKKKKKATPTNNQRRVVLKAKRKSAVKTTTSANKNKKGENETPKNQTNKKNDRGRNASGGSGSSGRVTPVSPVRPKVLLTPYKSKLFFEPPVTVSLLEDEPQNQGEGIDLSVIETPVLAIPSKKTKKRKVAFGSATSTPSNKKAKLNVTLEEGEIRGEDEVDVMPLFALDTTGDPDNFTGFSLPQTPDVVFLHEVKRTPHIGRQATPMRTQRYGPKGKNNKGKMKNLVKAMKKRFAKRGSGKGGEHWTKHLEKSKSESNVAKDDFGPRQVNLVATTNNESSRRAVNPFFSSANATLKQGQLPPPSPATIINALHKNPSLNNQTFQVKFPQREETYQFQPNQAIKTDFTSGARQVEGGVFQFTAKNRYKFPSMGIRQASRSALVQNNMQKGGGMDNVYVSQEDRPSLPQMGDLRPIVIDGSNVAKAHAKSLGRPYEFSSRGIDLVVDYFLRRGHKEVFAVVPQSRQMVGRAKDPHILHKLEREGRLVFTPARRLVGDRRSYTMYDDRYIVQYSALKGAIMVSNDNFRDLVSESPQMREAIENRLLMFTFMPGDTLMFPQDPMGKTGPPLERFLRF